MTTANSPKDGSGTPRRSRATKGIGGSRAAEPVRRGKRVAFDAETWAALDLLAHDSMKDFRELSDEAFRDLLGKHGRPTDLKTALRGSVRVAQERRDRTKP